MKLLKNEKGIALVMVLVLALTSVLIVLGLIYMVTQSTTTSGALKFYSTAEEASFGAIDIGIGYIEAVGIMNILGIGFVNGCDCGDPNIPTDNIEDVAGGGRTCRCDKICDATADWAVCAVPGDISVNPTQNPDFAFNLPSLPSNFTVFVKIEGTSKGNSDQANIIQRTGTRGMAGGLGIVQTGGGGVTVANGTTITPPHNPYLYRLEIQSQATVNAREVSRMMVLYAY